MKRFLTLSAIMYLMAMTVWAQTRITGVVTSAEDGSPVAGAVVSVTGNNSIYALTDSKGHFTLTNIPSGTRTVDVSVMGMLGQTLPVSANMQIVLSPDREQLEDGVDGRLCELDPKSVCEQLLDMMRRPEECKSYSEKAKQKVFCKIKGLEEFLALVS